MNTDRAKLYASCDKLIEYMLYTMVFFIPTSKSVIEVFATLAIIVWLYKNGTQAWEWFSDSKKLFVPPQSGFGLAKIILPAGIAAAFLVYSSIMISIPVMSHHFNMEGDLLDPKPFVCFTVFAAVLILIFLIIVFAVLRARYGLSLKVSIISLILVNLVSSTLTTGSLDLSAEAFLFKTMEYILIFVILAEVINTPRRIFNLIFSFLLAAFLVGLDGIYQRISGYDLFRKFPLFENAKITAAFKAPNGFGSYLAAVLPLPLALIAFNATDWKRKLGLAALSLLLAACLFLTFVRGAWIGFVAGFLLVFVFAGRKRLVPALAVLGLLVLLTAVFASPSIKGQMGSFIKLGTDTSSADRVVIWKTGWKMFADNPILGHGLNTFMNVFERYKPVEYQEIVYAHNCFLQIAAETGIIGLIVFLWFCASVFFQAISNFFRSSDGLLKAASLGAMACMLAFLVHGFVDNNLYSLQLAVLFWSLCGLAAARVQPE